MLQRIHAFEACDRRVGLLLGLYEASLVAASTRDAAADEIMMGAALSATGCRHASRGRNVARWATGSD